MFLRSCVLPEGKFVYNRHEPVYRVANLRENDYIEPLGIFPDERIHENRVNFPTGELFVFSETTVFEVPNFFPFRGVTYINKTWADEKAADPRRICLPQPPVVSLKKIIDALAMETGDSPVPAARLVALLPEPLALALGQTSTDSDDLVLLAESACQFVHDPDSGEPLGLRYQKNSKGRVCACITRHELFELIANNPFLPDIYKRAMVLRPGVQGESEIVGEWKSPDGTSHVFEYHRSNSYIPWGHYAANMADDAVRYRIEDLTEDDMTGLRHLYYQRTYVRIAMDLGLSPVSTRKTISVPDLERLREEICRSMTSQSRRESLRFNRTLWGWNFGFDFSPSKYRLHASHQQVHQQYALIPRGADPAGMPELPIYPYGVGDHIEDFMEKYFELTGVGFFNALIRAVTSNVRMDGDPAKPSSLIIHSDENVMLFVPKAQTSQWEINLLTLKPVGNIVEADQSVRRSLDSAILLAVRILSGLGARMITGVEHSKRIDSKITGQHLLYSFLPRLPESPGAFSEAQLRWINGHYPEDFAAACRSQADRCAA